MNAEYDAIWVLSTLSFKNWNECLLVLKWTCSIRFLNVHNNFRFNCYHIHMNRSLEFVLKRENKKWFMKFCKNIGIYFYLVCSTRKYSTEFCVKKKRFKIIHLTAYTLRVENTLSFITDQILSPTTSVQQSQYPLRVAPQFFLCQRNHWKKNITI